MERDDNLHNNQVCVHCPLNGTDSFSMGDTHSEVYFFMDESERTLYPGGVSETKKDFLPLYLLTVGEYTKDLLGEVKGFEIRGQRRTVNKFRT